MNNVVNFKEQQEIRHNEIFTPAFPKDIEHYDDGTWGCSAASQKLMTRSFKQFGFVLDPASTFGTMYAQFSFILKAATLLPGIETWVKDAYPSEMLEYLRAVNIGNASRVSSALAYLVENGAGPSYKK